MPSSSPPCGGWGTGWTEVLPACGCVGRRASARCCFGSAGLPLAAASLGGASTRCCVAAVGLHVLLRRCGCEWAWSPKGPRPERWVSDRLGLRGAATILHLREIHARCFLRVDRATRRKHRGEEKAPVRAEILPSRGPFHAKGESLPTRRVPKPRWTQDSAFACGSPNDAALVTGSRSERSILRPLTHERRILRHPQPRPESPTEPGPARRSRPFRNAGPLGATATQQQDEAPAQRRSSGSRPSHSDAAAGRDPATTTQPQVEARTDGYSAAKSLSASA